MARETRARQAHQLADPVQAEPVEGGARLRIERHRSERESGERTRESLWIDDGLGASGSLAPEGRKRGGHNTAGHGVAERRESRIHLLGQCLEPTKQAQVRTDLDYEAFLLETQARRELGRPTGEAFECVAFCSWIAHEGRERRAQRPSGGSGLVGSHTCYPGCAVGREYLPPFGIEHGQRFS